MWTRVFSFSYQFDPKMSHNKFQKDVFSLFDIKESIHVFVNVCVLVPPPHPPLCALPSFTG